jgi:hypothetical protein
MLETRVFDEFDPATGIARYFHYDHATGAFHIEEVQEVTDLVALNAEEQKYDTGKFGDGMHCVASIPMTTYMDLRQKGILKNPERLKTWLNDPNNRAFRRKLGRV